MKRPHCKEILSENFRVYLAYNQISITEASKQMGISRNTLTSIYYSKNEMIKFETLEELAHFMNCEVFELFKN